MYANSSLTADTTSRRHFHADHPRNQSSICQICHKPAPVSDFLQCRSKSTTSRYRIMLSISIKTILCLREVPEVQVFDSKCSTERFDVLRQLSSPPLFSNRSSLVIVLSMTSPECNPLLRIIEPLLRQHDKSKYDSWRFYYCGIL